MTCVDLSLGLFDEHRPPACGAISVVCFEGRRHGRIMTEAFKLVYIVFTIQNIYLLIN